MTPRRLALTAAVSALLLSRGASAQSTPYAPPGTPVWVKSPQLGQGVGVHAGDLELHWSLAGQAGYDSNYFLRTDRVDNPQVANGPPVAPVIPAMSFLITPSLTISTLGQQQRESAGSEPSIVFHAGVSATYRDFISLSSDSQASAPSNDVSSNRNVSGAADARLDVLPGRPWAAAFTVNYARSIQPNAVAANPDLSFNNDTVGGTGEIIAQPGSGTLDWHLGAGYQAALFEQSQATGFNNGTVNAFTRGRWNFRPKTALLYDGSMTFLTYNDSAGASNQGLVNSTPVRTRIGMNGLITNQFALLAMVGWGASFYDVAQNSKQPQYDSVIGQAELKWFLTASPGISNANVLTLALSSIALGYTRDFQNSYLGNFYGSDRGYLKFSYLFGPRAVLSLEGGVGAVEYPNMFWSDNTVRHSSFTDTRADATLFGEYRFTDTLGVNATLRYSENFSGVRDMPVTEAVPTTGMAPNLYDMQWARYEAYLGVRWFM